MWIQKLPKINWKKFENEIIPNLDRLWVTVERTKKNRALIKTLNWKNISVSLWKSIIPNSVIRNICINTGLKISDILNWCVL